MSKAYNLVMDNLFLLFCNKNSGAPKKDFSFVWILFKNSNP
jgi:hypothetical protein